ncbi:unnamed protein product, partial [Rotaria sp. Silwood1]
MRVLINTTNHDHDQVKVKIDITYQRWNQFDLVRNRLYLLWTDFYFNLEIDDEDYADQHGSSKASSNTLKIDLHFKHSAGKMSSLTNSSQENEEYNRLSFWKMKHVSYLIVAMVATRVLTVLATRAAVEREFSFTGNIITQNATNKYSPLDKIFGEDAGLFKVLAKIRHSYANQMLGQKFEVLK